MATSEASSLRKSLFLLLQTIAIFTHQTESLDSNDSPLQLQHVESQTSSITITWTSNTTHNLYQVWARSLSSGIVVIAQPTNSTEFTLNDLTADTPYRVCVAVSSRPVSPVVVANEPEEPGTDACLLLSTIKYIRLDSVLGLLGVVAFIGVLVGVAVVCWKCSLRGEGSASSSDSGSEEPEKKSDEERPLLDSDGGNKPPPSLQENSELPAKNQHPDVEPPSAGVDNNGLSLPADGQADKPISV